MALAPVGLFAFILAPLIGQNISRFDPRWLTSISFVVFAAVMLMRSHFNTDADYWTIMLPTMVQGIAVGFFFIPLTAITLSGIPPERIAAATGLSNFARITAGAFGTSIATTVWDHRSALRLVGQQAAMLGANDVFYGSAVLFVLLIPLVWLARPKHGIGSTDVSTH